MSVHFSRASLLVFVCVGAGVGLWYAHAAAPPAPAGQQAGPAKKKEPRRLRDRDFRAALDKTIDFSGFDDPKTTLIEALNKLASDHGVVFDVQERAFRFEMLNDVLKTELVRDGDAVPPMNKTTLATVLRKVLGRVPVPSGATYLIRRDAIEITTGQFLDEELKLTKARDDSEQVIPVPLTRVLWEEIRAEPLAAVLERIAEASDVTVLLDPSTKQKAATKITATLRNVPLDVALELLADMADLALVRKANAFYVTTPEKATRLQPPLKAEKKADLEAGR